MPKLTDKNLSKVIGDIPKKGFTAKYWQDHRSIICKGSGVAKQMNALKSYNIPPSGDPSDASIMEMESIFQTYTKLHQALNKAEFCCNKTFHSHSIKFIKAYYKEIERLQKIAQSRINNQSKVEAQRERDKKEEAKQFEKFKKEQEKERSAVLKELEELDRRALNMVKACDIIIKDLRLATVDVKKLTAGIQTQLDSSGKLAPELMARFESGFVSLQKKHHVPVHADNLKTALPKLLKEAQTQFGKYMKLEYAKEERVSAGKSIKNAQDILKKGQNTFKTYAEFHQAMAAAMNSAK